MLGNALNQAGRDFYRVALHIGKEIERVFDQSGLTKKAFAERIGRGANKINDVFEGTSCDSQLLSRISEVLHYDFFSLYQKGTPRTYGDVPEAPVNVSEPLVPYAPKQPPIQLVVNLDPNDEELEKKVRQLVKILQPGR